VLIAAVTIDALSRRGTVASSTVRF